MASLSPSARKRGNKRCVCTYADKPTVIRVDVDAAASYRNNNGTTASPSSLLRGRQALAWVRRSHAAPSNLSTADCTPAPQLVSNLEKTLGAWSKALCRVLE